MKLLQDIYQALQDQASLQRELRTGDEDKQCIRDLRLIDPRDDIVNIEKRKDPLFKDSYRWILDCKEYKGFTAWTDGNKHRLLWIKGDAGKGKTMLLIGIIRELSQQLELNPDPPYLSYFFCQGTDSELNTATAVLRCLVWMVLDQQPSLISHLRKKYNTAGPNLFKDKNTFYVLLGAFNNMLKDTCLTRVYLIMDALDECIDTNKTGLTELLLLISSTIASPKVKWLVSSRNRPNIESQLRDREGRVRLDLELNATYISKAVDAYIDHKLLELNQEKQYREGIRAQIAEELRKKADGTFLWVALVCKMLESKPSYFAMDILRGMPSDLKELYDPMMDQIKRLDLKDPDFCKSVLSTITLAYRPLHLSELGILTGLPIEIPLVEIVKKCASFLTIQNDTVYLVHQSAKDYLSTHAEPEIFPHGRTEIHRKIISQALQVMSNTLRRDIYGLRDPSTLINNVKSLDPDPLAQIRYACVYWIDHLCEIDSSLHSQVGLCDNGVIYKFLQTHFLHWLEALSLMRSMSSGVAMIGKLEILLAVSIRSLTSKVLL
jgi:NACHT domain